MLTKTLKNTSEDRIRTYGFRIANVILRVDMPLQYSIGDFLPSFSIFACDQNNVPSTDVHVSIENRLYKRPLDGAKLLSDVSIEWGERFRFFETKEHYITTVASDVSAHTWCMESTKDFKQSVIYVLLDEISEKSAILTWFIMVAYGQAALWFDTILIHASVVECGNEGYAFLGKSGTGKSTHSRLWVAHLQGFDLLNDDNPAIRLEKDGSVAVYGTPWSGKTPCYRNKKVALKGLVRLRQAQENHFEMQHGKNALIQVLPSCTAIRWNNALFNQMVSILMIIVQVVPIGLFSCLPTADAAKTCWDNIKSKN